MVMRRASRRVPEESIRFPAGEKQTGADACAPRARCWRGELRLTNHPAPIYQKSETIFRDHAEAMGDQGKTTTLLAA
jgi:hypothetical protein